MSPVVTAIWVGLVTVLWIGIVAGVWTFVSVGDEYPSDPSSVAPEE